MIKAQKTIYLDHAATTYLDPAVKKSMDPFWLRQYGNPSSLHKKGIEAKDAIETSRKKIAELMGARPREIIFTAGGTESINLAIFGIARNAKKGSHIVTTKIEHHAVLRSVQALEQEGFKATYLDVDKQGFISIEQLQKSVGPETVLVSVMYANNEIGTIEPIAQIGKLVRFINHQRVKKNLPPIIFHTDACQAAGACDINVGHLGVDLMSVNGSKIYGPKQAGFLYVKNRVSLKPIIYGGGQENGLRSGTENVPGIIGLAKALELAQKGREKENIRLTNLQKYFTAQLFKKIPNIVLNGPVVELKNQYVQGSVARLANNINISIPGVDGEALVLYLDAKGILASTGSACSTGSLEPSHVLLAIGRSKNEVRGSLRFSMGKQTNKKDLDFVIKIIPSLVETLRKVDNPKNN